MVNPLMGFFFCSFLNIRVVFLMLQLVEVRLFFVLGKYTRMVSCGYAVCGFCFCGVGLFVSGVGF